MARKAKGNDLAYVAGIIDGEGCIRLRHICDESCRQPYFGVLVEVTNTNEWLIKWLRFNFGGTIRKRAKSSKPRAKEAWEWKLAAKSAVEFLELILPYLKLKQPQAELAIEFGRNRRHKWRSEEQVAIEQAQAILMHKYNKRGKEELLA